MIDDRDYMRRPHEERPPASVARSVWTAFRERLRWLFRFCLPQKKLPPVQIGHDEEGSTDDFLRDKVDPILEKISQKGLKSLTPLERATLDRARAKIQRR